MTPQDEDFAALVSIVAEVFRITPQELLGASRQGPIADARHLVAAIWSERHTLQETAMRMNRGNHWTIQHSRKRVQRMLLEKTGFDVQAAMVVSRLQKEAPQILGNYPESEPTKKMREAEVFS